jgi:hypothetical protein
MHRLGQHSGKQLDHPNFDPLSPLHLTLLSSSHLPRHPLPAVVSCSSLRVPYPHGNTLHLGSSRAASLDCKCASPDSPLRPKCSPLDRLGLPFSTVLLVVEIYYVRHSTIIGLSSSYQPRHLLPTVVSFSFSSRPLSSWHLPPKNECQSSFGFRQIRKWRKQKSPPIFSSKKHYMKSANL